MSDRCKSCGAVIHAGIAAYSMHEGCWVREQVLNALENNKIIEGVTLEAAKRVLQVIDVHQPEDDPEQTFILRSGAKDRSLVICEGASSGGYGAEAWHRRNKDNVDEFPPPLADLPSPLKFKLVLYFIIACSFVLGVLVCYGWHSAVSSSSSSRSSPVSGPLSTTGRPATP